ncbi:MAG: hypothetical protein ACI4FO_06220 [Acutalibacteraceae bacterium]
MASFEEEALRRAQQLHSRPRQPEPEKRQRPPDPKPDESAAKSEIKPQSKPQTQQKSLIDFLLADKEQSLILLLLLLLSGEKADPSLLLALMYLLM